MAKVTTGNLSEWLNESVVSNLGQVFKGNTAFIIENDGKSFYYAMLFDTADIGGISKKSRNKDYVGGLLNGIKGSKIDTLVTKDLNEEGKILFIPTTKTIQYLSEYSIYTKQKYEFVKLNGKYEIVERTGIKASYDDFRQILAGEKKLTDFVNPEEEKIVKGSEEDPTVPHGMAATVANVADKAKDAVSKVASSVVPGATNIFDTVKSKISEATGVKDMVGKISDSETKSDEEKEAVKEKTEEKSETQASTSDNEPDEELDEDIYYSETQVITSIERIFHAENLDLPVSSDPFDQLFTLNNHLIRFDIDSRDTYVNERLNLMAAAANRDLQKLRSDNLRTLRDKYFMIMSLRVADIQHKVDISDQSTEWGSKKWSIDEYKREQYAKMPSIIEQRRGEIEAAYQQKLEDHCEVAAKNARNEYNAAHQSSHYAEMNRVEGIVKNEIDAEYAKKLNELYNGRRNEALTLLDFNVTGTLNELTEDYKIMFEAENALYIKYADEMREYVKELHAEDAKRLAVEEERNRISNEVNEARAEAAAKIELIKKEYEGAQAALEARSAATISKAESETVLVKEQMDARTSTLEHDKEILQKQLDDAIERADRAQEAVKADYEHRLAQAQDDRDSWKQTLDSYKEQHRHNNMLAAILVIAVVIAALAGGFVAGGVYWNRIVAGELSGNQDNVAINIINPDDINSSVTDESVSEEINETENEESDAVTTTVPEDDDTQTSVVTTVADEDEDEDSLHTETSADVVS